MKNLPPTHKRAAPGPRIKLAPPAYDWAWRKLRAKRLDLNPLCQHCEATGLITPAVEVDHIKPVKMGGMSILSNTQSLCKPCHQAKTRKDIQAMKGMW
ncbi:HNH endonuclease [Erythrobacter sp. R86502]|uniref:HNH endonuclease n=1 Tax=Erythrobacter sp. R86502 TaxID=3093846 RepID=UPI0036D369B7